ncbi:m serotype [Fusarium austroafricanum]|uniref:M serotype n=1 Tax=Fusarium austroafricanum TaxID=2364996 RepID=A0A8H4NZD6_9HYPO|nr:m serotype [Fusarium austroafricanum]
MSAATKKPPAGGVGRVSHNESTTSSPSPSRSNSRSTTPTSNGHNRTRSLRTTAPVSARAAIARRDTLSAAESDARAEAAAAVEDLQKRLENEEKSSLQYKRQVEVLQSKLDEAVKESTKLEEKTHEFEEQIETLSNEKREMTRQMREMESIYEAERSSILKEKEEMASREEEMQAMIQRLKDSLAQRNNTAEEIRDRPSRQRMFTASLSLPSSPLTGPPDSTGSSPSLENGSFAPPSSIQRSDSRNNSKLILQKDKLIESLRLELAEAQIKLVESENQGGGRLHEVERLLMEARMANARLMEDNESYQLLLQERTLKGDFGQNDFSYMGSNSNQDALAALEGKAGGSSLADELSEATEGESVSEGDRRLEAELKSMKEQNKALTLYINKIIERLLQHQDFESILDTSSDLKSLPDTNKELPPAPADKQPGTILQRAKSMAVGPTKPRPRPISVMQPSTNSNHTDPDKAPSIPIGLSRSTSTRRSPRPQSDQYTGAASLVSQMYRGPDGPVSPPLGTPRHSQTFFSPSNNSGNPNAAARVPSGTSVATSGNFPGVRSETSSLSGESGELSMSTPPSHSPPRSHTDRHTTSFAGGKPRPLRLVQENPDAVKENKRSTWYSPFTWGAKKEEQQVPSGNPIPE